MKTHQCMSALMFCGFSSLLPMGAVSSFHCDSSVCAVGMEERVQHQANYALLVLFLVKRVFPSLYYKEFFGYATLMRRLFERLAGRDLVETQYNKEIAVLMLEFDPYTLRGKIVDIINTCTEEVLTFNQLILTTVNYLNFAFELNDLFIRVNIHLSRLDCSKKEGYRPLKTIEEKAELCRLLQKGSTDRIRSLTV